MGDPAGVGPECIVFALKDIFKIKKFCKIEYVIIGSGFVLDKVKGSKQVLKRAKLIDLRNVKEHLWGWGRVGISSARASIKYIDAVWGF